MVKKKVMKSWKGYRVFHKKSNYPIKFVYASNISVAKKKAGDFDWRKVGIKKVV